jgi:hypothetical protein
LLVGLDASGVPTRDGSAKVCGYDLLENLPWSMANRLMWFSKILLFIRLNYVHNTHRPDSLSASSCGADVDAASLAPPSPYSPSSSLRYVVLSPKKTIIVLVQGPLKPLSDLRLLRNLSEAMFSRNNPRHGNWTACQQLNVRTHFHLTVGCAKRFRCRQTTASSTYGGGILENIK